MNDRNPVLIKPVQHQLAFDVVADCNDMGERARQGQLLLLLFVTGQADPGAGDAAEAFGQAGKPDRLRANPPAEVVVPVASQAIQVVIMHYPDNRKFALLKSPEDVQAALVVDKNHVWLEFIYHGPSCGAGNSPVRQPSAGKGSIPSLQIFRGAIPEKQPALMVPQRKRKGSIPDIDFRSALVAVVLMYEQYFHFVFGPFRHHFVTFAPSDSASVLGSRRDAKSDGSKRTPETV
jgi:hypothetical protein